MHRTRQARRASEGLWRPFLACASGLYGTRVRHGVVLCLLGGLWTALACSADLASPAAAPREEVESFTNSIGMKMMPIPPGKFWMGSTAPEIARAQQESKNNWYDNEGPRHEVVITKGFFMSAYPVTQAQYRQLAGKNPSWFSPTGGGKDDVAGLNTDDFPVETVSWADAKDFCDRLSKKENKSYRVPTEAEWELACRAGSSTQYYTGNGEQALKKAGWYRANSGGATRRVGQLAPNAWGLCDMHGNVCQWCQDWYAPDYYGESPRKDPTGPAIGECRVLRGGSWLVASWGCRSAARAYGRHDNRDSDCGFRVLMSENGAFD